MEMIPKTNMRVLVVEDESASRFLMELIMEERGCVFEVVRNGAEAVKAIKEKKFNIVFMDLRMPIMDGIETTKIIRRDISKSLPIIAVTAHAIEDVKEECYAAGMNGFIVKPFDVDRFKADITGWIKKFTVGG